MTLDDPRMLERLWDLSRDMLCIADHEGRFMEVNPRFAEVLGWTEDELESTPYIDFVHPDDKAATRQETEGLARGEKTMHFENRYRCKDGSWKWLSWTAEPVGDMLFASARDITDRKRQEDLERHHLLAQERARAMQDVARQQRLILNAASHELFTPLTPINLASARLRARVGGDPSATSAVDTIERSVRKLQTTITSLLYLSQLATERLQVRAERVSVAHLLRRAAEAAGVGVRPRCEQKLAAHVDEVLLEQAVAALLRNAAQHGGGATRLEGRQVDEGIRLEVADEGPGFEGDDGETWFLPLQRGGDTQTMPGSGLGLTIVRLVAAAHGGRAGVESPGRHKGTTAWITVPRA